MKWSRESLNTKLCVKGEGSTRESYRKLFPARSERLLIHIMYAMLYSMYTYTDILLYIYSHIVSYSPHAKSMSVYVCMEYNIAYMMCMMDNHCIRTHIVYVHTYPPSEHTRNSSFISRVSSHVFLPSHSSYSCLCVLCVWDRMCVREREVACACACLTRTSVCGIECVLVRVSCVWDVG